jgi:cobalamin-dependent methionine synthase I
MAMLKEIIEEKTIEARAFLGFYPCNSNEDDDIEIYDENDFKTLKGKWCTLRQ